MVNFSDSLAIGAVFFLLISTTPFILSEAKVKHI
ncbi:hypothetical protein EDD68_10938 [Melghiribacillus thermohalophilus]|uniref:Uncharacterized protein n=1 Tax=Melghiribacillus thermohalophilus TaxID=1324956 RepID=A0A4V2V1T3_9BACI|nr:hypothetical protein EDD68_10938 [Melghiribacillus thermohalophilus]